MSSRGVVPDSSAIRSSPSFGQLDNVLGVVYEAALKYMSERKARAPTDLLTFVPFCGAAHVGFANESVRGVDQLLAAMMQYKPHNGTNFGNALDAAHAAVQEVRAALQRLGMPSVLRLKMWRGPPVFVCVLAGPVRA